MHEERVCVCVCVRMCVCVCVAGPLMRHVWADKIDLKSNTHTNTPWTWEALHVPEMDVHALSKLPKPGPEASAVIRLKSVVLSPHKSRSEVGLTHTHTHNTQVTLHTQGDPGALCASAYANTVRGPT